MLYIVNFDIKDSIRMDQFIQQLNQVGECCQFMPRCYCLKTEDKRTGKEIYNRLKSVLLDEDLLFIVPARVEDMNGWLTTSAVEWIKNAR